MSGVLAWTRRHPVVCFFVFFAIFPWLVPYRSLATQVLIYGLVSNYYPTRARAAGVAWCAGFGRLGGIVGPVIGGLLVGAGVGGSVAFLIFAGLAVLGAAATAFVPQSQIAQPALTARDDVPFASTM